jgi:hypothetical protein
VVIDNFDVRRPVFGPTKTEAPLSIHANAVPASTVVFEGFEVIVGRDFQVDELHGGIKHTQFALHDIQ